MLDRIEPGAHRVSYEEVRGDAYTALGDEAAAREAYQRAVEALDEDESRPMLQMKLDDLRVAGNVVAETGTAQTEDTAEAEGEDK